MTKNKCLFNFQLNFFVANNKTILIFYNFFKITEFYQHIWVITIVDENLWLKKANAIFHIISLKN